METLQRFLPVQPRAELIVVRLRRIDEVDTLRPYELLIMADFNRADGACTVVIDNQFAVHDGRIRRGLGISFHPVYTQDHSDGIVSPCGKSCANEIEPAVLVDHFDTVFFGILQFRAGAGTGNEQIRLLRDRA